LAYIGWLITTTNLTTSFTAPSIDALDVGCCHSKVFCIFYFQGLLHTTPFFNALVGVFFFTSLLARTIRNQNAQHTTAQLGVA
jgi:hypothetical protein